MLDTYLDNKRDYKLLLHTMTGGGSSSVYKYKIITTQEKDTILKNYKTITEGKNKCTSYPRKTVELAVSGMYIRKNERKKKSIKELCYEIDDAHKENKEPFVHNDSMTAWGNEAAIKYGLTVGQIMKMKFGDKIDVILFDRNIGEYVPGKKAGDTYDPTKIGCSYGTYIHGEGLTGILNMKDVGVLAPFTWEINKAALGDKMFWGPIDGCDSNSSKNDKINIYKLDKNIKVGWRGPAILMSDAAKHLPKSVTHYDTWWDDYLPYKQDDLSKT